MQSACQDSGKLGLPNLSDILYAYGGVESACARTFAVERGLFLETLIETLELTDEHNFFEAMKN